MVGENDPAYKVWSDAFEKWNEFDGMLALAIKQQAPQFVLDNLQKKIDDTHKLMDEAVELSKHNG